MEMHTTQSLYNVHGITSRPRRRTHSHVLARLLAIALKLELTLRAELRARRAATELRQMDDRMLHDIGIVRSEIDDVVRATWLPTPQGRRS